MTRRIAPLAFALVAACGSAGKTGGPSGRIVDSGSDVSSDATDQSDSLDYPTEASAVDDADGAPDPCAESGVPPSTLECAGLYSDLPSKTLSPLAQAYAPAVPFWSDGAVKERWIELPPGQKIDVTDPSEWLFPVGTKLFKQFSYQGKRVETRLFQKIAANSWVHATYAWNADDSATTISYGETVAVNGGSGTGDPDADPSTWVIPPPEECDACHRGRSDRILGFEQVSLGLAGATGLTLLELVVRDLVTPAPTQVNLRIGDDGTGVDAPALSFLHVNCGVTCHNGNENAQGYGARMLLRLDPSALDGSRVTADWDALRTTIGALAVSGSVQGQPRISPGNPSASVIVQLISQRGVLQMPPIATRVVDDADVAKVVDWVRHMSLPGGSGLEAGADSSASVSVDGGDGEGADASDADATLSVDPGDAGSDDSPDDAAITPDEARAGDEP